MKHARTVWALVTLAYAAVLAILAFLEWDKGAECPWYWPVLAFLGAGVLLQFALGPRRWWAAIAFGVLGAAWIEAAQAIWMPLGYGRFEDAAWGAVGTVLGVAAGWLIQKSMRSQESFDVVVDAGSREPL